MSQNPLAKRPAKKPLDIIGKVSGVRVCGHKDDFNILKGEGETNQARRRVKWEAKRCPSCVEVAQKKEREEAAKRRKENLTATKFRLPHGSAFSVSYDAETMKWSGTLTVPGNPAITLSASCGGVHNLLQNLGRRWHAQIAAK